MMKPLLSLLGVIVELLVVPHIHGIDVLSSKSFGGRELVGSLNTASTFESLLDKVQNMVNDNRRSANSVKEGRCVC